MKPLAGFVVGIGKGSVRVKLCTGTKLTIRTKKKFKYGDEVIINYNFRTKTVRSIELASDAPKGTQVCQKCSQTSLNLGDDDIEDIF
jgi:hypothetical protein